MASKARKLTESLEDIKNNLRGSIKTWYCQNYPDDELCEYINDISFADLWKGMLHKQDVYSLIGEGDSIIRERLFKQLSKLLEVDYDVVYNVWLKDFEDALNSDANAREVIKLSEKFPYLRNTVWNIKRIDRINENFICLSLARKNSLQKNIQINMRAKDLNECLVSMKRKNKKRIKESLQDLQLDFDFARKEFNKVFPDLDFNDALEKFNDSEYAVKDFYAAPVYSEEAWDNFLKFAKNM